MGAGVYGEFKHTFGSVVAGDAVFNSSPYKFFSNISKRKDIDYDGVYDVVAHGGTAIIQVAHNGRVLEINSRTAAKLIKAKIDYKRGQAIRLLSCNTGSTSNGFAQNLANKLNVVVKAPTKLVWAYSDGRYIVAARRKDNPNLPDLNNLGRFKEFYPGGKKK